MADRFPLDGLADLTPEAWLAGMADISEGGGADFYDPYNPPEVVDPYGFGYGRDNEDHYCVACGADLMLVDCRC